MPGQGPTLEGWKAIADYLRTGIAATPAWLGGTAAGAKRAAEALYAGEPLIPTYVGDRRVETGKGSGRSAAEEFIRGYEDIPMTSEADLAWANTVEKGSEALPGSGLPAEFLAPGSVAEMKGLLSLLGAGGGALGIMKAYHGSPHVWGENPDLKRVSTAWNKIGTGEGNQAYAFGHYSAENKDLGEVYAEGLSKPRIVVGTKVQERMLDQFADDPDLDIDSYVEVFHTRGATPWSPSFSANEQLRQDALQSLAYKIEKNRPNDTIPTEEDILRSAEELIQEFEDQKINHRESKLGDRIMRAEEGDHNDSSRWRRQRVRNEKEIDKQIRTVREAVDELGVKFESERNLYGLIHDVNEEDLLDWDAEIFDQSEEIQEALNNFLEKLELKQDSKIIYGWDHRDLSKKDLETWYNDTDILGEQTVGNLLAYIDEDMGIDDKDVAEMMRESGIPGLKFLDRDSRNKKRAGEDTEEMYRNIVMFRDDLTYLDPETTDPETLRRVKEKEFIRRIMEKGFAGSVDDIDFGKPYRTVGE